MGNWLGHSGESSSGSKASSSQGCTAMGRSTANAFGSAYGASGRSSATISGSKPYYHGNVGSEPGFQSVLYSLIASKLDQAGAFAALAKQHGVKGYTKKEEQDIICSLGNAEYFYQKYLQLNCLEHNEMMRGSINAELELMERHRDQLETSCEELPFMRQKAIQQIIEKRRSLKDVNVRLFISKIGWSDNAVARSFVKGMGFKYGAFHVGLDLDGVILEWGTGPCGPSIVYPTVAARKLLVYAHVNFEERLSTSTAGVLTAMITNAFMGIYTFVVSLLSLLSLNIFRFGKASEISLRKVAKTCTWYNDNVTYRPMSCNCQTFIEDVLKALNLEFKPGGEFKKFMDGLTQYGTAEYKFGENVFQCRGDLEAFADANWDMLTNEWDKRLLLCYSDTMEELCMFELQEDKASLWGPIDDITRQKWAVRLQDIRAL